MPVKTSRLYLIRACLALGVLYYALRLSAGDRGAVDFAVIAVVVGYLLWSLLQLGRTLRA